MYTDFLEQARRIVAEHKAEYHGTYYMLKGIFGGGGGGGSGTQTVTQKADPWIGIQPQLTQAAGDTKKLYDSGLLNFKYYPDSTVAPQSDFTKAAINLTANRALSGSPVTNAANTNIVDTLNGKYLDPATNPYFKGALNNISDAYARGTAANTDSAFNRAGAFGGSAYNETKGVQDQAFANSLNDLGNTQYQQGRAQQLQAASLAPQAAAQDYADISALANAGDTQDQYNQGLINANIDKFNYNQQAPANAIQNYIQLLNGTGGNLKQTQTISPYAKQNNLGLGLGSLAQLGGSMGGLNSLASGASAIWDAVPTAASVASFFSDARLKQDISLVGEENGHKIYHFSYKNDPQKIKYQGVMAQDVILKNPEAIEIKGDYMAVNYDKIGVEFKEVA